MEREPNLVISSASQRIVEDGLPFKVDNHKLEGGDDGRLCLTNNAAERALRGIA